MKKEGRERPAFLFKGFRFGMVLQFAVGPVCLLIFQTAVLKGFRAAQAGVWAAVLGDAIEIAALLFGLKLFKGKGRRFKHFMKLFGTAVLFFFGACFLFNAVRPSPAETEPVLFSGSIFFPALIILLSNPLTTVFWAGVLSAQSAREETPEKGLVYFSAGCLLSTLVFLSALAFSGTFLQKFMPPEFLSVLSGGVGLMLIGFGVKTLRGGKKSQAA